MRAKEVEKMAHNKVYGICESKCRVEVPSMDKFKENLTPLQHITVDAQLIGTFKNHEVYRKAIYIDSINANSDVTITELKGYAILNAYGVATMSGGEKHVIGRDLYVTTMHTQSGYFPTLHNAMGINFSAIELVVEYYNPDAIVQI